jgi:hypothetical protein
MIRLGFRAGAFFVGAVLSRVDLQKSKETNCRI